MKENDFLRFALLLSSGQASTFKKNLTKMIKLILFDNYGDPLTIYQIRKQAEEKYALIFSDQEIRQVLKSSKNKCFIMIDDNPPTFTLHPDDYAKLKKTEDLNLFDEIISRFLSGEGQNCPFSESSFKDIIYKYIYQVFNSDIHTLLSLMNYRGETLVEDIPPIDFDNEHKLWLNNFLNWQDTPKNKLIFDLISSGYEFCMMTIKKDNKSYNSLFKGKEFFIDSNIIFRLAGFHNKDRQDSTISFLNKCKSCGININYTNFTNQEIDITLDTQVLYVQKFFAGQTPISLEAFASLLGPYTKKDFHSLYYHWTQEPQNKVGDYESFKRYLKRQAAKYLNNMHFVSFESFNNSKHRSDFQALCMDLKNFKNDKAKETYLPSIEIDVQNYLYLKQCNEGQHSNSFLDKKYYFITADHNLIEWANNKCPGAVPTFVLPSVWYSLMLKYDGRSTDDYNAFCYFLNLRMSTPEDKLSDSKEQILSYIVALNESAEIKEEMIYDINERLSNGNLDITDIESFVEESHVTITERKVSEALAENEKGHAKFRIEAKETIESTRQAGYKKGKEEGYNQGIQEIIEKQAKMIVKRNKIIRISAIIGALIAAVVFLIELLFWLIKIPNAGNKLLLFMDSNPTLSTLISFVVTVILSLVSYLHKQVDFLSLDIHRVINRLQQKFTK